VSLSAVIIHYRGGAPFRRCVESCLATSEIDEVLVVDNGGLDASAVQDDRVRLVTMAKNVGYGVAANAGLAAAISDHVLVLNQDTEVTGAAISALMLVGLAAGAWIAGPRLDDGQGTTAPLKERFAPPVPWTPMPSPGGPGRPVPWISGAAMLFLPGHTGLRFDDRLFMYAEDEELCARVWEQGGSVVVVDEAVVVHIGATSTRRRWSLRAITLRTIVNRARFVVWHRGWSSLPAYLWSELGSRVERVRAARY
jgi:N-acetylglucosaminyl-diphospho-decaprenol L-rhamnosyltransferase